MKTKKMFIWLLGSVLSALILMALSCLGFAMKSGLDFLLGGTTLVAPELMRERWLEGLKWLHFSLMGATVFTVNLIVRREDEIVFIKWPHRGLGQLGRFVELLAFIVMLEVVAYLIQFVVNAICVAVTTFATDIKVANTISLKYLFSEIDLMLITCEAFIASQFLAFFDRRRRRRLAERREVYRREMEADTLRLEERKNYNRSTQLRRCPNIIVEDTKKRRGTH